MSHFIDAFKPVSSPAWGIKNVAPIGKLGVSVYRFDRDGKVISKTDAAESKRQEETP